MQTNELQDIIAGVLLGLLLCAATLLLLSCSTGQLDLDACSRACGLRGMRALRAASGAIECGCLDKEPAAQ